MCFVREERIPANSSSSNIPAEWERMQISPDANVTCLQGQNRLSLCQHPQTQHTSLCNHKPLTPLHSQQHIQEATVSRAWGVPPTSANNVFSPHSKQSTASLVAHTHKHTYGKDQCAYLSVMASASEYWFIKASFHSSHSWKWLRPRGKRHNAARERESTLGYNFRFLYRK